jgi:hypothetical protein
VLEGLGLFLGELAGLDELVHERLIARDLHQAIAAEDVGAAVADLAEEEVIVHQRGDGRGGAHAAARAIELGLAEDAQAGGLDGAWTRRAARASWSVGASPKDMRWWMMSTASWLATSPAAAPPMPSQTPRTAPRSPTTCVRSASIRPRLSG